MNFSFLISTITELLTNRFRASLLGPFHGAIAVPSVTRCRCRRRCGHRCAGGVRQYSGDTWWIGVRRLVVANGPNIFQMLLVSISDVKLSELENLNSHIDMHTPTCSALRVWQPWDLDLRPFDLSSSGSMHADRLSHTIIFAQFGVDSSSRFPLRARTESVADKCTK